VSELLIVSPIHRWWSSTRRLTRIMLKLTITIV